MKLARPSLIPVATAGWLGQHPGIKAGFRDPPCLRWFANASGRAATKRVPCCHV